LRKFIRYALVRRCFYSRESLKGMRIITHPAWRIYSAGLARFHQHGAVSGAYTLDEWLEAEHELEKTDGPDTGNDLVH